MLPTHILYEMLMLSNDIKTFSLISKDYYKAFRFFKGNKIRNERRIRRLSIVDKSIISFQVISTFYYSFVYKNYNANNEFIGFEKYCIIIDNTPSFEGLDFINLFNPELFTFLKCSIYTHHDQHLIIMSPSFLDHYYVPNPTGAENVNVDIDTGIVNNWKIIPDGPTISNNQCMRKGFYINGKMNGWYREWDKYRKLVLEEFYIKGKLDGVRKINDRVEIYDKGYLIKYDRLEDLGINQLKNLCRLKGGLKGINRYKRSVMLEFLKTKI